MKTNEKYIREKPYSKFSFKEVYHQIYGQKFSFMVMCEPSCKT